MDTGAPSTADHRTYAWWLLRWLGRGLVVFVAAGLIAAGYRWAFGAPTPTTSAHDLATGTLEQMAYGGVLLTVGGIALAAPAAEYRRLALRAVRVHAWGSLVVAGLLLGAGLLFLSSRPIPANAQSGIVLFLAGGLGGILYGLVLLAVCGIHLAGSDG